MTQSDFTRTDDELPHTQDFNVSNQDEMPPWAVDHNPGGVNDALQELARSSPGQKVLYKCKDVKKSRVHDDAQHAACEVILLLVAWQREKLANRLCLAADF